jgi:hypothetical protein
MNSFQVRWRREEKRNIFENGTNRGEKDKIRENRRSRD